MSSTDNLNLKKWAAVASVGTASILSIIKAGAAVFTGSLSVLSSMIDSLSDVISSLVTLVAIRISDKPLTDKHRYGYGKIECVSALVQAAFIAGSAAFILYDGINRFIKPVEMRQTTVGIIIMLISLLLTFALIIFQKYVVKKTASKAIAADSAHYVVDVLSNLSVIVSLIVVHLFHIEWFDVLIAVLIAIYLLVNAYQITAEALAEITDEEVDEKIKQQIIDITCKVDGIKGCHDFRSRAAGSRIFIEMHIELDGNLTLYQAHTITDEVEKQISVAYPHAQIIIHQDPYGIKENRLDHQINGTSCGA